MQSDSLDDTRWALEYVNLHGVSHLINGRRIPEIAFADGRVTADDGVNVAEGTYSMDSGPMRADSMHPVRLSMSIQASTSLSYPGVALPEHDLFEHLSDAHAAIVHGDFLHIRFGEPAGEIATGADGSDVQPGAGGAELVYRWEEDEAPA